MIGLGVAGSRAAGARPAPARARLRYLVAAEAVDARAGAADAARDTLARPARGDLARASRDVAGAEPASLFDAQLLMLDDPMLTRARRRADPRPAPSTPSGRSQQAGDELGALFDEVDDPYLRERQGDLQDVLGRLRMNLHRRVERRRATRSQRLDEPCVFVADDLPPSVAAQIDWTQTRGVRHRCRQLDVSHRDSGALAGRARDRRRCGTRRERIAPGSDVPPRRHDRRGVPRRRRRGGAGDSAAPAANARSSRPATTRRTISSRSRVTASACGSTRTSSWPTTWPMR